MNQNQVFLSHEGDAWFKRNGAHLLAMEQCSQSEDVRYLSATLKPLSNEISRVLEIGCSNGMKLESICESLNATGVGIDPSVAAIESGKNRKKSISIDFLVGSGDVLNFETASFDFLYFGFCLYVFDRSSLLRAFAEADRVLKPGGFLAITDFDPGYRIKRTYHHSEGLFSYKQDYSTFFTQTGIYYLFGKHCFSHRSACFDEVAEERISTILLYKEKDAYPTFD